MQKRLTQKSNIARNPANSTIKIKKEKDEVRSAMWDMFDKEVECVYDERDDEELTGDGCKTCGSPLRLGEESF